MADEFVAGLVKGISTLARNLEKVPAALAKELLYSTWHDVPRPPWNTGQLRNSGYAYVGSKLVAQTERDFGFTGANPNGLFESDGISGMATGDYWSSGAKRLTVKKLLGANINYAAVSGSLADQITIMYQAPHAALMHDWVGGISDPDSGPGYVSLKLAKFGPKFHEVLKQHYQSREVLVEHANGSIDTFTAIKKI